jgi:hypothetical protein
MRILKTKLAAILVLVLVSGTIFAQESSAPQVTSTVPKTEALDVDPALKEISVTFDKDMMTKDQWSWVMESKETFPKVTGPASFKDNRTCVLPVKLEPGKTYRIWINAKKQTGFRDVNNIPAVPYLLVFQTKR